jgi:hypothetical protein
LFGYVSDVWSNKYLGNKMDNLKVGIPDWGVGYGVKFLTGIGLQIGISHTVYGKIDTLNGQNKGWNTGWNMGLWSHW